MPRPQFSIRTLIWLTLVVAAFLGGIFFERERLASQQSLLEVKRQEATLAEFKRQEQAWLKKQSQRVFAD